MRIHDLNMDTKLDYKYTYKFQLHAEGEVMSKMRIRYKLYGFS